MFFDNRLVSLRAGSFAGTIKYTGIGGIAREGSSLKRNFAGEEHDMICQNEEGLSGTAREVLMHSFSKIRAASISHRRDIAETERSLRFD